MGIWICVRRADSEARRTRINRNSPGDFARFHHRTANFRACHTLEFEKCLSAFGTLLFRLVVAAFSPPAQFLLGKDVSECEKIVQQGCVETPGESARRVAPCGEGIACIGNHRVGEWRINLQSCLGVHEQSGFGEVVRSDDQPRVRVVAEQIDLRMKDDLRLVVMNVGFDATLALQGKQIAQSLMRSVFDVHAYGDLREATRLQKLAERSGFAASRPCSVS